MIDDTNCQQARMQVMAALDDERDREIVPPADARQHLASCSSCAQWIKDMQSLYGRFEAVSYGPLQPDLWPPIATRIRGLETPSAAPDWFWVAGALVLGWRALQLLVDPPLPPGFAIVPLLIVAAALWRIAGQALAVQTFAPELQKRGV